MKNKGFTLIELLAVITILSVILTITVIAIGGAVSNSKANLHSTQLNQIKRAAEYYNNKEGLKDQSICISVSALVEKGYLKDGDVKDPSSNKNFDGSVVISYNGKKYSYDYVDYECINYIVNSDDTSEITESIENKVATKTEGIIVKANNIEFYVLEDSPVDKDYVVGIKKEILTANDLSGSDYESNFDSNNYVLFGGETYQDSNPRKITETWVQNKLSGYTKTVNNSSSRLLTLDELLNKFAYEKFSPEYASQAYHYKSTENTPTWIYTESDNIWTMSPYEDSNRYIYQYSWEGIPYKETRSAGESTRAAIRPVVYLLKSKLDK